MAVTLASTPTYPVPNRVVRFTPTLSGGGNWFRIWVTNAPTGTQWRNDLDTTSAPRLEVYANDTVGQWEWTPTKGGVYVFKAQEYTRGSGGSGGYQGAPSSAPSETKIGSETTISVYVGQRLTQTLGIAPDTATLALWVWNDTIRATSLVEHGEKTPSVTAPTSPKAITATLNSSLITAVAALANVSCTTALGTLSTVINDIIDNFNLHTQLEAGVHDDPDSESPVQPSFRSPDSPEGTVRTMQEVLRRLELHMRTDAGTGTGTGDWHDVGAGIVADWANLPVIKAPGNASQAMTAVGAAWAAYEAHRVSTAVHGIADATNTLDALPAILNIHRLFATAIQANSPTAPETVNGGVTLLVHSAGFSET